MILHFILSNWLTILVFCFLLRYKWFNGLLHSAIELVSSMVAKILELVFQACSRVIELLMQGISQLCHAVIPHIWTGIAGIFAFVFRLLAGIANGLLKRMN